MHEPSAPRAADGDAAGVGPMTRDEFTRRTLVVTAVAVAVATAGLVLIQASSVFLLLFAAILLAILLRSAADATARWTGMSPGLAFAAVLIVLALAAGGATYLAGSTAADQLSKLTEEMPKAAGRVREYLERHAWGREILRRMPSAKQAMAGEPEAAASRLALFFSTTFGAIGDAVVLLFLAVYLAASPRQYIEGTIRLVPPAKRPRAREVLGAIGERLKGWMLGQLVGMATLAVLTGVGLRVLGVPQALILALLGGLLVAIPYLGPIGAAAIAVLATLPQGQSTALWTLGIFSAAEAIEGYVVTPLVQQRTADLPPVVTLLAIALAGLLFGVVGLIVATPLAVAIQAAVEELYIKDVLGDREA